MKKGDLSINIIIVAAIALIILVIISVLLFGSGRDLIFAKSCKGLSAENQCFSSCADITDEGNWIAHPTARCDVKEETCCIKQ